MKWKKSTESQPKKVGYYCIKNHCGYNIFYWYTPLVEEYVATSRLMWVREKEYEGWQEISNASNYRKICGCCELFEWLDEECE